MAHWIDTKLDLWHSETGKNMALTTMRHLHLWQKWHLLSYFSPLLPQNLDLYTKWMSKMLFSIGIWKKRSIRGYHMASHLSRCLREIPSLTCTQYLGTIWRGYVLGALKVVKILAIKYSWMSAKFARLNQLFTKLRIVVKFGQVLIQRMWWLWEPT